MLIFNHFNLNFKKLCFLCFKLKLFTKVVLFTRLHNTFWTKVVLFSLSKHVLYKICFGELLLLLTT